MDREEIIRMAREAGFSERDAMGRTAFLGNSYDIERFAALVAAAERNKLAAWMIQFGFATGHGDTMEQLVDALGSEIVDRIECEIDTEREACAKLCEELRDDWLRGLGRYEFMGEGADYCADAIRARGEK